MRRLLSSLAVVGLLAAPEAQAQLQCLSAPDRTAIEVAALRSQLMVLATGCRHEEKYNAFIRKYQPDLMSNERAIGDMFKRKYGKRGQQEHDRFSTELANAGSNAGVRLGTDFCDRNGLIFAEVMSLRSADDLPAFAAGKDLVPPTMQMCTEVAQAPAPAKKATTVQAKR